MRLSDDDLMLMFRAGTREAFDMLYERHRQGVFRFALSYLGRRADAEDVVQETFVRLMNSADDYSPQGRFEAYLFRIAINRIRSSAGGSDRRREAESSSSEPRARDLGSGEDASISRIEERQQLEQALDTLEPTSRMIVGLRYLNGLNSAEIARTVGLSSANVRVILHRSRKKLRQALCQAARAAEEVG